jgi:MFS family permease
MGHVALPDLLPSPAVETRPGRSPLARVQRHRAFVLLWSGATAGRLATEMYGVAVVLFVLAETGSAHLAGLTVAAATFPTVITGPVVGAWLDRTPHRRTAFLLSPMILVAAMVGFLLAGGRTPGWVLVVLGFVAGLPSPVRTGGFSGPTPTVVPQAVLPRAYGFEAASYNIAGIAGPATAGAVAGAAGASWAIVATMGMAVVAVAVIAQVPITPGDPSSARTVRSMLNDGLGLLWRVRPLRAVSVATTISQGAFGLVVVAYPLLAQTLHHKRAVGGLLFSVFALGALAGSVLYARLATKVSDELVVYVGLVAFGVLLGCIGIAPTLPTALVISLFAGIADGPMLAATLNLRQRVSPDHLRTQVFTTAASLKIGAFAIGSAFAGFAATSWGSRGMLVAAGAGQLVAAATGLATRRRSQAASTGASAH